MQLQELRELQTQTPACDSIYVSFDIGSINPAFTVGYYKITEHTIQIVWIEKTDWKKKWKESISLILSTYQPQMVLIEKQISGSTNTKYMQYIREEAAFRHIYHRNVDPPFKTFSKKYKERKQVSVDRLVGFINTIRNVEVLNKWKTHLLQYTKLDDLADSFNLLINFVMRHDSSLRIEFL